MQQSVSLHNILAIHWSVLENL